MKKITILFSLLFFINISALEINGGDDLQKILVNNVLPKLTEEEIHVLNQYIKYQMIKERLLTHSHVKNAAETTAKEYFSEKIYIDYSKKLYENINNNYNYTNIIREREKELDMPSDFVIMSCVDNSECDVSYDQEVDIISNTINQIKELKSKE